ncbi:hypothetical protein L345_02474, partial [Ophiophagus hannah]
MLSIQEVVSLTCGPGAPDGPCGPGDPASPFWPDSPCSPLAPGWPSAPCIGEKREIHNDETSGEIGVWARRPGFSTLTLKQKEQSEMEKSQGHTPQTGHSWPISVAAGAVLFSRGKSRDRISPAVPQTIGKLTGAPRVPAAPLGPAGPDSPCMDRKEIKVKTMECLLLKENLFRHWQRRIPQPAKLDSDRLKVDSAFHRSKVTVYLPHDLTRDKISYLLSTRASRTGRTNGTTQALTMEKIKIQHVGKHENKRLRLGGQDVIHKSSHLLMPFLHKGEDEMLPSQPEYLQLLSHQAFPADLGGLGLQEAQQDRLHPRQEKQYSSRREATANLPKKLQGTEVVFSNLVLSRCAGFQHPILTDQRILGKALLEESNTTFLGGLAATRWQNVLASLQIPGVPGSPRAPPKPWAPTGPRSPGKPRSP